MPEYRIVAKIDPSGVVAGSAKVKQELRGVDAAAAKTTGGIDRMTAAEFKAAGGMEGLAEKAKRAANDQKGLEAAAMRVKQAVDQEAAALQKVNRLLDDAHRAYTAGKISAEQYARVQALAAQGGRQVAASLNQQRAGYTQLGFQIQDITQQMALGVNPMVILAQQSGQTASAMQMALGEGGTAGRIATFLAGPWGSIIIAATAILGTMAYKFIETGNAIDEEVEKLRKDAEETRNAEIAKQRFANTLEGVQVAVRDNAEALRNLREGTRSQTEATYLATKGNVLYTIGVREQTLALLKNAEAQERAAIATRSAGAWGIDQAVAQEAEVARSQARLRDIQNQVRDAQAAVGAARDQFGEAQGMLLIEQLERLNDPIERIKNKYDDPQSGLIALAARQATAEERVNGALQARIQLLQKTRDAAIATERASSRSDGVSRFRSREQAVGVAGRELQGAGLRVSENVQFGGVQGNHPGMGNRAHGLYAIDVNVGRGIVEANVPDLRRRFDELARLYQSRGYKVVWNRQVYHPFGNGPGGAAAGHADHFHLEAPKTIVGRPTQSSTAAQTLREAQQAATAAEQQADFVDQIVTGAQARGHPQQQVASLRAQLDKIFADYKRRFDEEMSPERKARIVTALTEAEARETAEHFNQAYVYPLERLQVLQGETGISREVLNVQIAESARLGRALTPVEEIMIANSVRQTEKLGQQQAVLESIRGPLQEYADMISTLTALLQRGEISQTQFNARIAALGGAARDSIRDLPGVDPATGQSYGDLAARADESARYAQELANYESNKAQLLALGISYNGLIEAAHRRHVQNLNNIDLARRQLAIQNAMAIADSLVSIAEMSAGKQSAVYKVMFAASKAFAIADAIIKIQQGIANALAIPWPANLAAIAQVAAAAASIVSSIQAVTLNLAEGGMVRGPGGPRDDRVPANLSPGEYVVNAAAVARPGNRALLDAVNSGSVTAGLRRARNDNMTTGMTTGGDTYNLQFGDVVVQTGAGTTGADGREIGREVKAALRELVDERIKVATKPGGHLTRARQSVVG